MSAYYSAYYNVIVYLYIREEIRTCMTADGNICDLPDSAGTPCSGPVCRYGVKGSGFNNITGLEKSDHKVYN